MKMDLFNSPVVRHLLLKRSCFFQAFCQYTLAVQSLTVFFLIHIVTVFFWYTLLL